MTLLLQFYCLLLPVSTYASLYTLTGVCDQDEQCNGGCCAVHTHRPIIRRCFIFGEQGESCDPYTKSVPFEGLRMEKSCPCGDGLDCCNQAGKFKCLPTCAI